MVYTRLIILCLVFCGFSCIVIEAQNNAELYLQQSEIAHKGLPFYNRSAPDMNKNIFLNLLNNSPSFGLGKDNYFLAGVPTNKQISKQNSDIKYQISIRQRLTKTVLPYNTYLLFTYNQKAFWNVLEYSSPFKDVNYNPTLGFTKIIFIDNKFTGVVSAMVEHESNGRDSIYSRSWNYVSLSGIYFYNSMLNFQTKFWIPFVGDDNLDLMDYKGIGMLAINAQNRTSKFRASLVLNFTDKIKPINTTLNIHIKINKKSNQFLFIQFYNGYAEGLLNYNKFTSMVRVGISIKNLVFTIN